MDFGKLPLVVVLLCHYYSVHCITISVADGCEEGIRHGDQCYIANNVKVDRRSSERMCRPLGADSLTITDDDTFYFIKNSFLNDTANSYWYRATERYETALACGSFNSHSILTCSDSQLLLFRTPEWGYSSRTPGCSSRDFTSMCPYDPEASAPMVARCAGKATCRTSVQDDYLLHGSGCSGDNIGYMYTKQCSSLSVDVITDRAWDRIRTTSLDIHGTICVKPYVPSSPKCPIGTYSADGYDSDGRGCSRCPFGTTTTVTGATQCSATECIVEKRVVQSMKNLNRQLIIYADFKFNCTGRVSSYEFFAEKPGRFYVGAWRPEVDSENTWTMVDYNNITVTQSGSQVYYVNANDQMSVEANDVIGIFYDDVSNSGVVPMEHLTESTLETSFSRYLRVRQFARDLDIGTRQSGLSMDGEAFRTVPLNAQVEG